MSEPERTAVRLKVDDAVRIPSIVDPYLKGSNPPDLVLIHLDSEKFPRRTMDFPEDVRKYVMTHPKVKMEWCDECIDVDLHKPHNYIDMTMVSVFYDAGINELRKDATRKAVSCWMKQLHLPKEMMFIELGFNGVFTFSKEDFPEQIDYIRIDGNDSHKYLFQKEHLWNIAAKRAKYEKLMFVDSDIAPLQDVDWFKQVHDALDKCLFTQGFEIIQYLNQKNKVIRKKFSYTYTYIHDGITFAANAVPSGVLCLTRRTWMAIGGFNVIPDGSSDVLFWYEIIGQTQKVLQNLSRLFVRSNIQSLVQMLSNETKNDILRNVSVSVTHFYHGEFVNRSYEQRTYLWLTQYPWTDIIISYGDNGLFEWVSTDYYFFGVMSNFHLINDSKQKVHELMKDNFNYIQFVNEICELNSPKEFTRMDIIKQIRKSQIKNSRR